MTDDLRLSPVGGFLHPAMLLAGLILAVALVLMPFALVRSGSGGPGGLAAAAGICFAAGLIAEGIAWAVGRRVPPLGLMLIGMCVRVLPPLAVCVYLAANGHGGRQHLAFIVYLLTFYLATLALETYFAVRRVAHASPSSHKSAR